MGVGDWRIYPLLAIQEIENGPRDLFDASSTEARIALEPEELAGLVLDHIKSHSNIDAGIVSRYNFSLAGNTYSEFPSERQEEVGGALMEAWIWLEREGLIAPNPGDSGGLWFYVTKRGKTIAGTEGLEAYRRSSVLPRKFLHPLLHRNAGPRLSVASTMRSYFKVSRA